jgi:hypothetical protein
MTLRLKDAGFSGQKWYYPITDHWFATKIYSENALPDVTMMKNFIPYVADDLTLIFDERELYCEIVQNGAFEFLCGAYLVEARVDGDEAACPIDFATPEISVTQLHYLQKETKKASSTVHDNRFYHILKVLAKLGYKYPAIYGMGERGKRLKGVFNDYMVPIAGQYDKSTHDQNTVANEISASKADCLIVSILGGEDIAQDLREQVLIPVFTVEELVQYYL